MDKELDPALLCFVLAYGVVLGLALLWAVGLLNIKKDK